MEFVQYICIGNGLIENTHKIPSRNDKDILDRIDKLEKSISDIKILGFRYYTKNENNEICNVSGIKYIRGDIFVYPAVSKEVLTFIKNNGSNFKSGEKGIIILSGSYPFVYKLEEKDSIVDIEGYLKERREKEKKLELEKVKKELSKATDSICKSLENIIKCLKDNNYTSIPTVIVPCEEGQIRALNICDNDGDFEKNLDLLKSYHKKIIELNT